MAAEPLPLSRLLLGLPLPLGPLLPLLGSLLLLLPPPSLLHAAGPGLGRRFAERKLCADPECTLLMYRGKAMRDFQGPDCRFVNFKKGEAVYVYYKLIGKITELWAGSVGNDFGYFPKDLLEINHDYSEEEVELPTDETDFVCFDSGRDDFDNYNVDELLKSLQETTANEGDTEPSDPGTKPAAGDGRHEEIEQAGAVKSLDALETDKPEPSTADDKEAIPMPEEADSSLPEGTANTGGDSSAHSHNANSQGDQTAHEHLKGMLHGKLKGLEYENTKNTNIPQVETSQLDQENEEVHAYTLLNRELSGSLQTKLGSTADAVVSDDEVTRLVTCPEEELEEGRSTDPPEAEEEPGFADEPEELPLLSFMAEEEMPSLVDLEGDGNHDAESQSREPDEGAKGATELHNQRETGEEPDSDAFIKDAFTESKKLDASLSVDRSEYKQTKEKQDEVVLISKREASDTTQSEHLSKELLRKEPGGTGDVSAQGNTTEQSEEQLTTDGTDSHSGKLKRTALPDPHLLPSPGQDLESKAFVKSKQDVSKPSVSDINESPVLLSQREKGEKKVEDDTLEEVLEKDVKHKRLWEKTKEKGRAEDKPSVNVPAKSVEEVKNESQSDLEYTYLLKEKLEHGMPAVEKEMPRYEEGLKQAGETDHGNPKTTSLKKEPEMNMRNMKETLAGQGDPSPREAVRQSRPWENEHSEPDVKEELSRNLGKMTAFEESIEKSSPEEKSERAAQNTNRENLTQQGTARSGDADSDRNLGTKLPKARTELQSEEPDAEENSGLKQGEEELLEDENAASAKLSQARAAHVQGDPLHVRSTNPELEGLSKAVSESTDEAGEEINSFTEEAKKTPSVQGASEAGSKEAEVPGSEDAKWHEVGHTVEDPAAAAEPFEAEEPPAVEEHPVQSPDTQRKNHIPEGISQKHSQEVPTSEHPRVASQQSAGFPSPADSPAAPGEPGSELSESVRRLRTIRAFLDEKRVLRLHKYLGLQQVLRIEAMLHDMQVEMELAGKAGPDNEELEKALDQILEFSESSVLDFVGKVLDSRVVENKEEVVKEMDLYDEESALMDDIQELIYSLRTKYSSASESVPLASAPEQQEDQLHLQDGAKQAESDRVSIRNPSAIGESNQEFHQPEEKRPEQPLEEEEERAIDAQPQHEEANFLDGREAEENNSERGSLLEDSSFGSTGAGQSGREDTAAAPDEDEGRPVGGREEPAAEDEPAKGAEPAAEDEPAASSRGAVSGAGAARELLRELVAALPEEIRPGPDFHGIPWEPVIVTALVGIATLAIMFWRTCLSVKSRIYQVTEKQLAEKIKNLLQEKSEILDKISKYDQKIREAKESVKVAQEQKDILSDETAGLKDTVKELKEANRQLDDKVKNLHTMLETETKKNEKKQNKLSEAQKAMERLQESISAHSAELSEVQIALNEAKLSEEKVKSELHHVQEENARLKKSKEQLLKEAEGWSERHTELSEQIKLYQKSQKDIEETLAYKETEIEVLTNCIMQLKQLDMDSASEAKKNAEGCGWSPGHELANGELPDNDGEKMKSQIKQMMDVSRVKAKLSIVEEDRNLLQSKLNDEVAARHELEEQIKKLEHDSCSLKSAKDRLETECRTLQQKVEILGELYQQKEMALQKKLTQEEYERQEKEQKLSAADEKAVLAIEELKVYKQRIQDMEEELQQTERSYKNQIAAHEKKAHDNWLIARSAERALAEEKREAANLRQKLIEVNQKLIMLQRPLIVKPTPGRPSHQVPPRRGPLSRDGSFGPSPVSGGNPSPTQLSEVPPRPLSAPRREGSRGEFGSVVDGPPVPQRPPELPGRMSVPDLRLAVASVVGDGPRTSSPSTAVDGVPSPKESEAPCVTTDPPSSSEPATAKVVPKGPPPFPGTAGISSPVLGPPPPLPVRYGPPGAAPRLHFGPPRVRGAPLPAPAVRDFFPGPPLGMRDVPPGPLPPPPDPRGYGRGHPPFQPLGPPGPRDHPPGPWLPPPGSRDYTPSPNRDLPPAGPRDHPAAPPKDSTQPPVQKP